jgi:REP-associated tyrosine transposase
MPNYRRVNTGGGAFFFTVALADRASDLLIHEIDRLRKVYRDVQERRPFETIVICILPDHIHALWKLPEHDRDFSVRWESDQGWLFPWHRRTRQIAQQGDEA